VHYGRTLLPLRNAGAVALVALTLLTGIDHPWTRGPDAASVPRACGTLDKETANTLSLASPMVAPQDNGHVDTTNQQNSVCDWPYAMLSAFGIAGSVNLEYTRYQTDADANGARRAAQQVAKAEDTARRSGSQQVTQPPQLTENGGFAAESGDHSTFTTVAAYNNIVVTLRFATKGSQLLPMPDPAKLLNIETSALRAVRTA
jgi:hypothetical protein